MRGIFHRVRENWNCSTFKRCMSKTYYDSQSGKHVAIPGQKGLSLHDVSFECITHFDPNLQQKVMNMIHLNPATISIKLNSTYGNGECFSSLLASKTSKPKLNCPLESLKDLQSFSKIVENYESVSIVLKDKSSLNLASEALTTGKALQVHIPSNVFRLENVQETINWIGIAADAGANIIIVDPIAGVWDEEVLLNVVEGAFGLDVEGEPLCERLGITALKAFTQFSLMELKLLNIVCSDSDSNLLPIKDFREGKQIT